MRLLVASKNVTDKVYLEKHPNQKRRQPLRNAAAAEAREKSRRLRRRLRRKPSAPRRPETVATVPAKEV